jgi:hypothetical protein
VVRKIKRIVVQKVDTAAVGKIKIALLAVRSTGHGPEVSSDLGADQEAVLLGRIWQADRRNVNHGGAKQVGRNLIGKVLEGIGMPEWNI